MYSGGILGFPLLRTVGDELCRETAAAAPSFLADAGRRSFRDSLKPIARASLMPEWVGQEGVTYVTLFGMEGGSRLSNQYGHIPIRGEDFQPGETRPVCDRCCRLPGRHQTQG